MNPLKRLAMAVIYQAYKDRCRYPNSVERFLSKESEMFMLWCSIGELDPDKVIQRLVKV